MFKLINWNRMIKPMDTQTILNEESGSKFVARKWNIAIDQSNTNYDVGSKIIYNTNVLKFNLHD